MAKSRGSGMRNYIIRRLLLMIPTFIGVTVATFLLCQFVPGGPIEEYRMRMAGGSAGGEAGSRGGAKQVGNISEEDLAVLKKFYGFDKPVPERYANWFGKIVRLDLGMSTRYTEPVIKVIAQRLPISIYYGVITTVITYLICIPLGMLKAIRHRMLVDNATSVLIFVGYAIPGFALGAVLLNVLAAKYNIFPLGGFTSDTFAEMTFPEKAKDLFMHSFLPLICYLIGSFASMTMLMKNGLMENMGADYVKTALAKGLTWKSAVFVHAMRNSLIPLATSFGHNISLILTGALLIERVFNIKGMGLLVFESIQARDYPLVLGTVVIGSLLSMLGNLLSDMCVAAVDPRVRFE